MNQKQMQRTDPPKKLRKLNDLCIHKHKYLTSHSLCQANAQMCSQKCQRVGHVDQPHDFMQIEELIGKVKQLKDSKIEITSFLFNTLESTYKQQQEYLYNKYREAKNKIEILCFQDDEQIKLIQLIDVGKVYMLDCSHVYYLKNIAVNKQQVAKQAEDIIKKFKDSFINTENKNTTVNQDLKKEKVVEIVSIMKNHFKGRLDEERKNYLNKHLEMQSNCRKIQAQCKAIKKKYEKTQAKLTEALNNKSATIEPVTQSIPKKPQPKSSAFGENTSKNENKSKISTTLNNYAIPTMTSNILLMSNPSQKHQNHQSFASVPFATKIPPSGVPLSSKKISSQQLQLKQKIKQKILRQKQQKMKSAQKSQQPQQAQPIKQITFKPLSLVIQQTKVPQISNMPPPALDNIEIPIKGFVQATSNLQNTSFSLFVEKSKEEKAMNKIGEEIKLSSSASKPAQQSQPNPTEQKAPQVVTSATGIFEKHRQYQQQKKDKLDKQRREGNSHTNKIFSSMEQYLDSSNIFHKQFGKPLRQVQKQQQSDEDFGLFDKPKPHSSKSDKMQDDNEDKNFVPVFSDALKNSNEGFFFKKKPESNNSNNSNNNNQNPSNSPNPNNNQPQ